MDSFEALISDGLSRTHGNFELSLNNFHNQWAAAVATHEPDDDVSWDVVAGQQAENMVCDVGDADNESNDSAA